MEGRAGKERGQTRPRAQKRRQKMPSQRSEKESQSNLRVNREKREPQLGGGGASETGRHRWGGSVNSATMSL